MASVEYGVGSTQEDVEMHYTTNGETSLCGKYLKYVFRWSQYPNRGEGCNICSEERKRNESL